MSAPPPYPGHRQSSARIRCDWGSTGAAAISGGAAYAVVVDVLSFTTAVTVAVERGIAVLPYRWRDDSAGEYAVAHDAVLAVGRSVAREFGGVSLSPVSIAAARGIERLVLPSPNGSTICHQVAGSGAIVVAASLRNADAVAAWLAPRLAEPGASVAVVAAGERWPDESLRPAVEDLWGAGAVVAGLLARGVGGASPEARVAAAAHAAVVGEVTPALTDCASGRELMGVGFGEDVLLAAQADAATVVPVLADGAFVAG